MRSISSASNRISASFGDRAIVAVRPKDSTLMPMISGSRKPSAVAPFISITCPAAAARRLMAAMPV